MFSQIGNIYIYIHIYIYPSIYVPWIGRKFGIRCSFLMACARKVAVVRDREATLALELQECQAGNARRAVIGMVAIEMDWNGSIRNSWILIIIIINVGFPISPWDFQAKKLIRDGGVPRPSRPLCATDAENQGHGIYIYDDAYIIQLSPIDLDIQYSNHLWPACFTSTFLWRKLATVLPPQECFQERCFC